MKKTVLHHIGDLGIGGTQEMLLLLCKHMNIIDKESNFIHTVFYPADKDSLRFEQFSKILGKDRVFAYGSRPELVYITREIKPFITHRYSAGIPEFPFIKEIKQHCKHFISTSVFGNQDETIDISKVIYVSSWIRNAVNKQNDSNHLVVRNPVEDPLNNENLRKELNIDEDTFVFGHIGRPDPQTFDNLNLLAYSKIETDKTCFVIMGVEEYAKESFEKLNIKNYRLINKSIDTDRINRFYNTLNVMTHSRKDGECNSSAIWNAQSRGKPIISHYGLHYQGHIECIQNSGFVTKYGDVDEYSRIMKAFADKKVDYEYFSNNAKSLWKNMCYALDMGKKQLDIYKSLS